MSYRDSHATLAKKIGLLHMIGELMDKDWSLILQFDIQLIEARLRSRDPWSGKGIGNPWGHMSCCSSDVMHMTPVSVGYVNHAMRGL